LNVWTQDAFWTFSSLAVTRLDASGNLRGQKNKNKKPRLKKVEYGQTNQQPHKKIGRAAQQDDFYILLYWGRCVGGRMTDRIVPNS